MIERYKKFLQENFDKDRDKYFSINNQARIKDIDIYSMIKDNIYTVITQN